MRGSDHVQDALFSVTRLEDYVSADHPPRKVRDIVNENEAWNHSVFSKNWDRLLEYEIVEAFFTEVMTVAGRAHLLSRAHFSVDGMLIQAWASHKRFRPREGSDEPLAGGTGRDAQADFKSTRRCNDTHASTADSDARRYRKGKGQPAILAYQGHVLMESRSGLGGERRGHAC